MNDTLKSNSLMFAGPFLGEFGWEISHWAPHVRWLRSLYKGHHIIAASSPGRHPLYYGFVNEFWPLPEWFMKERYEVDCFEALAPENIYGKLLKHFEDKYKQGGQFSSIVANRTPRGFNHQIRNMGHVAFDKLKPSAGAVDACNKTIQSLGNKPCVVIFAREVRRTMYLNIQTNTPEMVNPAMPLPSRNWPRSHWEDLFEMLYEEFKDQVTFVIGGTKHGNCLLNLPAHQAKNVIDLTDIAVAHSLDITIAFLQRALCSISSQSGPTHLSLQTGCPSFVYGHEYERHAIYDNPLKTDVCFFETTLGGYNDSPETLFHDSKAYISGLMREKFSEPEPHPNISHKIELPIDVTFGRNFIGGKGAEFNYSPDIYAKDIDGWIKTAGSSNIFLEKYSTPWFQAYEERWKDWFSNIDISGRILELGFNDGKTLYQISQKYPSAKIDALDFNHGLERIKPFMKSLMPNLEDIWIGDCRETGKPDGHYDFISCIDFFEHLPPDVYIDSIKESHRILKEGGSIFVYAGKSDAAAHINVMPNNIIADDMEKLGFKHTETISDMMIFKKLPVSDRGKIKKIGMIGVFDVKGSTNISFAKAFRDSGFQVEEYNYRSALERHGPNIRDRAIIDMSLNNDLLIFCKGNGIPPDVYRECAKNAIVVFYMMDAIEHLANQDFYEYADAAHFSVVTYMAMKEALEGRGIKNVHHHLQGVSPDEFHMPIAFTTDDLFYQQDVVFVGTKSDKRDNIISKIKSRGYSAEAFGHGYQKFITGNDFNEACMRSKVCLAINNTNPDQDGFSDRILRYMATKSFVIAEYSKGLERYFTNGEELVWFKDIDELKRLLDNYLGNDELRVATRKEIAEKGYKKVLENYTWKHVAEKIIQIAKGVLNDKEKTI